MEPPASPFISTGHVLGIAHRGASLYAPENTLVAFRLAIEHGASAVECDVRRTRDGHLVIIHDHTVDRTTDGHGAVSDYTLADLRRLDAGSWFGQEFSGERIPLLDEVLATLHGRARIQLEIKNEPAICEGIEQQIVDAVRRHGMEQDAFIISFDHQCIQAIRTISAQLSTGILYDSQPIDALAAARAAKANALCAQWRFATHEVVAHARNAGLEFFVWTVDDEEVLRRCLSYGVNGVTSNDTLLLGWLAGDS